MNGTKKDLSALKISPEKKAVESPRGWRPAVVLPLLGLALLAGFLVRGWVWDEAGASAETAEADTVPPAATPAASTPANDRDREVLTAIGYVVAHHRISLGSKVLGRVAWIGVDKGDVVRKGDLLVKLDDREYRAQADQARAELAAVRSRLAELEAGSRPQEIERAQAELTGARFDADNARKEYQRLRELLAEGFISDQDVANAQTRSRMAEAAAEASAKNLELVRLGPRAEQLDAARAQVERAEAALEYASALLDATEIRAPIDGTVLQRIAEIGEMITTSFAGDQGAKSAVVALADLNDLQVELDISQADFKKISRDQDCRMVPEAYPDRPYVCRIAEIAPEADRQKATIQVKVQILEPDPFLRPDMDARVTFTTRKDS